MNKKKLFITLSISFLVLAIVLSTASITGSVIGANLQGLTIIGIVSFIIGVFFFVASKYG